MIDRMKDFQPTYGDQAEEMQALALEYMGSARERISEGTALVKDYVAKQPARALGLALGMGVLLGWLIKRR